MILDPPYREGVTDVTPWFRALRPTGLLLLLLTSPSYTPQAAAYEPVPAESRAGSVAGEGRERPGREARPTDAESASAHPDGSESPDQREPAAPPKASRPPSTPPGHPARASEPVLRVLPLGSGLVLIGLGLALTFLALKTRKP
ncbi:hypothetical protein QFZ75_003959 [Streptomyces sp. V3I8]|uniref:hypothetical protein n=1 Tax=Streptomyces sp. V3I8 TaxID=3042279 RepID=UPI00278918BB|nr:hypothetical protein [Streptomyces sp. V3I8]MDQ1037543.1 hypothetical protein [Streptomyces sp. V3I8]